MIQDKKLSYYISHSKNHYVGNYPKELEGSNKKKMGENENNEIQVSGRAK